jgi:hypothetical protein
VNSGQDSGDRETLGKRLKSRQVWGEILGWLVGIGLVVEYWNEIVACFVHRRPPSLDLIGGILATAGVFGEVWFSRLVLTVSDELQARADSDAAQANERAAQALDRAAQALDRAAQAEKHTSSLQIAVADARERQLSAEQKLRDLEEFLAPRAWRFDIGQFVEAMRDRPKARAIFCIRHKTRKRGSWRCVYMRG